MKKLLFITVLNLGLLTFLNCFSQNKNTDVKHTHLIDSLLTLIKTDKADTNKAIHLNALSWELMYQNLDTAIAISNQALAIITPVISPEFSSAKEGLEEKGILSLRASTLGNLGTYYNHKADYPRAIDYYLDALKIDEELKDKYHIARHIGSLGTVYSDQGNYPKALDCYLKALKMAEELNNKDLIAPDLGNIGSVYCNQGDYPKALEYFFKALTIAEEVGDTDGVAGLLGNIGVVYSDQGNHEKALDYYFKALKIAEKLGNKYEIATNLNNIGAVYYDQKDYPKALDNCFKALQMNREFGDKEGMATYLGNIGSLYTITGKFKEAEKYLKMATALDDSIGNKNDLRQFEEYLSQLYDTTGRYKEALIHYKKAIALKDTIFSQESKKQLIRKEMNFEFDKKEAAVKAEHDKEMAVAAAEKKKQRSILILVSCVLILVFLFAGFIFRSLRITRRQKKMIEQQKEIVETQKEKIVDSITYAQRIQQSILMEESEVQQYLPESFIYYQPKDIVSGDFYWCSKIDDKIIIAAVDCTGHGVPGAFMSMIGNTLLNQIVNEKHITTPSEILRYLNLGVYEALHQQKDGTLSLDGMDIALCSIDYPKKEIQYAGAQNPLYLFSEGQLEVIKGDIHEIGGGGLMAALHDPLKRVFVNHIIPVKENMSIYLFSDGYVDQFGGIGRKKLGTQRFKDLLLNNQHLSMQKQKELIASAHIEWKGNTAQIDDILVIGIKI